MSPMKSNTIQIGLYRDFITSLCNRGVTLCCSRDRMTIFQSGIALLCKLSSNDKHLNEKRSAVEWSYFNLLTGTIKMYRKIPAISENEGITKY